MKRCFLVCAAAIVTLAAGAPSTAPAVVAAFASGLLSDSLPAKLPDQEFWRLTSEFSEPNGFFRSDNLLSNEVWLQYPIPDLVRVTKPGRVYMGVGPEQNFTYIAATRPRMAFIVDVRRGNRDLHLMYKALFELAANRVEFVSRLFSRPLDRVGSKSTVQEIFAVASSAGANEAVYNENLRAIRETLLTKHRLPLSEDELKNIADVYHQFFWHGPGITYSSSGNGGYGGRNQPTYADLMTATDGNGQTRSYLASEENFLVLKELESRNMLVPVVGNFAGPKAIRAVGRYLREKSAVVSAFYLSNVEQYLMQDGLWQDFCRNVGTLPLDETSRFIRATRSGRFGSGYGFGGLSSELGVMALEVKGCVEYR